ncbi:MAG: hypothetical protein M1816_000227 [Peltula sp. TS41687]|nr:MAG: hypothetical protein M1816_000227 [Peltula sp. TS41687]
MAPDSEAAPPDGKGAIDDAIPDQIVDTLHATQGLKDNGGLKHYLVQHGVLPTQEDTDAREAVIETLRQALCHDTDTEPQQSTDTDISRQPDIPLVLVPVGSFGLGVWTASSDIDCLVVGMLSPKTFWALTRQRLGRLADQGIRILRVVKASSGTMSELKVCGIRVDLQYCPATKVTETWPKILELPPSDPIFDLSPVALKKLNAYRDMHYLLRTIPDLDAFQLAHRFLKDWALNRGMYSTRFAYLSGFHITLLLARLQAQNATEASASDIVRTFFRSYAEFDWPSEAVFDPTFHKSEPRYPRSAREPLVILSLHSPIINIAQRASMNTVKTLSAEFKRANQLLANEDVTWSKVTGATAGVERHDALRSGAADFINNYKSYINLNIQYWGSSSAKRDALLGWLESRCPLFLAGLSKMEEETDLSRKSNIDTTDGVNRTSSLNTLQTALQTFVDQIRNDKRYFDPNTSWIEMSHVKQSELGSLKLDERPLGSYIVQNNEDDSDESEVSEDEEILSDDMEEDVLPSKRPSKSQNKPRTGPSGTKLRPATDILNRLRWDPSLDSSEYVVGYEDRFKGTREIPLERWKSEQTDEEFIPQHRIVHFKRKSDGVIVWDKEKKVDKIFGSGVKSGTETKE